MKKLLGMLLILCLLLSAAGAETVLNGGETRDITIHPAGNNPILPDVSPTTGRARSEIPAVDGWAGWAITQRYMPVIVQIDNAGGGVVAEGPELGKRAPWGVDYVDVIFETPLYKGGQTRLSFLFSDVLPTGVGPVRSTRVFHAWLREEWDCGFCYYGEQKYTETNVPAIFKETGANKKGVLFSGTVGSNHEHKKYYFSRNDAAAMKKAGTDLPKLGYPLSGPHDMGVNVAAISTLIPAKTAAERAWLFTDELPTGGDEATQIHVTWGHKQYNSLLEWDEDDNQYYRYMIDIPKSPIYADLDSGEPVSFSNVIVQFTPMQWVMSDAPKPTVLGTGNADYFIGGRHFAGVWQREDLASRTVFYGEDGEEIKLNPGRTLIIVMDYEIESRSISFE